MSGFVKIAIDDYYSDNNWTTIINKYWMLAERVSDPRVHGWYLFDTPLPTLALVLAYLAFVVVFGPMLMATRKAYQIKRTLVAYNAGQVLLSTYMFYEHLMSGWWGDYSLSCQPVDYSDSDSARRMLHLCWVYYFSKLSEFADTIFFVLRKKKSQITWLHLYHHSLTPFEAWLLVKFIAGGHGTFSNVVNNLVHIIMYAYYMMAAMGPQYQKYLWWKKHLTTLQLVQFFMVLFHSISALVYDCGYPKVIASALILHSAIFIVLFMNFYFKAYLRIIPKKPVEANNNNVSVSNSNAEAVQLNTDANAIANRNTRVRVNNISPNDDKEHELKHMYASAETRNGLNNLLFKDDKSKFTLTNGDALIDELHDLVTSDIKTNKVNGSLCNGNAKNELNDKLAHSDAKINGFNIRLPNGDLRKNKLNCILTNGDVKKYGFNKLSNGDIKRGSTKPHLNGLLNDTELNDCLENNYTNDCLLNGILKDKVT